MNYIGHKGIAVAILPILFMPVVYKNINTKYEIINETYKHISIFVNDFYNLIHTNLIIFISSLIFYWIGSTLIDFIDFKIIKKIISKEKQKFQYYYHRQWTHGFIDNLIYLGIAIYLTINISEYFYILTFYFLGVWTHLIADMLSGSIPILFYGNYAKKMSRIGINRIVPKTFENFFSKVVPKLFDKIAPALFIIGIFLIYNLKIFNLNFN